MGQTATLLHARRVALTNARRARQGAFNPLMMILGVFGGALVLGLGELAAGTLMDVPTDTATPVLGKRAPVAGDSALEAAFWLAALLAAFFAFRVMESLFRSPNVRALELFPVTPFAIFAERTLNAMLEGGGYALLTTLLFLPLTWHGHPHVAALCGVIVLGAMLCTAAVTIGTNAWFGAQYGGSSGLGDSYGGQGGAFIYSPMVSLALSVGCILMLQLGVREVLHSGRVTNAFWLGIGIAAAIAGWTLVVGGRHFVASYHRVAAFFREADEVGFRAVMDYQTSSWAPTRPERLAGDGWFVFRRHSLQFARRFPVGRSLAALATAAAAVGAATLSEAAFPGWAVAVCPAAAFALLERPFARIHDELLGGPHDALLPIRRTVVERATVWWWCWEVGRLAVPFGVGVGLIRGATEPLAGVGVAAASLGACAAIVGAAALAQTAGARGASLTIATLFATILCTALGALHLLFAAAVGALLCAAGIAATRAPQRAA